LTTDKQKWGILRCQDGNEFQRSDAATGNVHRPTVVSRNGGTTNVMITSNVGDERTGRRHEQDHSFRYGGKRPCSTRWRYAMAVNAVVTLQGRPKHDRNDLP